MWGSSTGCQGPGPPPEDLPFAQRRVLCPTILVRAGKKQMWLILFTILLFITAAGSKEDHTVLNTISSPGWPTASVTALSTERPTNLGHPQQAQQRTDLSFTRSFHQPGVGQMKVGQHRTRPAEHADTLHDEGKRIKRLYLTSASVESTGTSLQELVSPIGTASLGISEGGSMFLHSRSDGVAHRSSAFKLSKSPTNILPSSVPSYVASPRKMSFGWSVTYEEHDPGQLLATRPPTSVTIPITQYLSSLWVSPRHSVESVAHVAVSTSIPLRRLESEKTTGVSTQQQLEPLSIRLSSRGPISRIIESPEVFPLSTAIDRSHPDAENSMATHLGIAFPYEESVTASPIHSLLSVESSSGQRSTAGSILEGSHQLEVSFALPLRNANPPVTSTMKAEFSLDRANSESNQLVPETTTHTVPSSVAGIARYTFPLVTKQLDFATAVAGILKEANPSLEPQSSLLREHIETSPTTPYFETSKEHEVSLVSRNMLNNSLVEVIKLEPKDSASCVVKGYIGPSVGPIYGTISGEADTSNIGVSFLNHQTSRSSPLSTLLSGSAKTGFRVPLLHTGLLETTANTVEYMKPLETKFHGRKGQTVASMKGILTSKSLLTAMEIDSTREVARVQSVDETYALPKKGTGATPLSPQSPAPPMSKVWQALKESSEPETITDSLATKVFSLGTVKSDSTLPSIPYLNTVEFPQPVEATSAGMTSFGLLPGGRTASAAVESFGNPSTEQKLASHATVAIPDLVELDKSLVTPPHDSLSASFTSIAFSKIHVPESTLKTYINLTEGHISKKGQMVPKSTVPFSATRTAIPLSVESGNTMRGVALVLPTKAPKTGLNTSAVMFSLGSVLGYKVTATNALEMIGTATSHIHRSRFTKSNNSKVPAYPSSVQETKSTQTTPVFSATTVLLTTLRTLPVESKSTKRTSCRNISCPVNIFTPIQSTSAEGVTSQPFLTRKFLVTILGAMDTKNIVTSAALDVKVSRSEERYTTVLARTKTVTQVQHDHTSQQPGSKFTTPLWNQSVKKENLTLSQPTSPAPTVHIRSLWFRLIKIEYTDPLKNKSSESYMKLEKEIKLTLKKMLSSYESFLQTEILRFLNGSVIVESQVVFQALGPVPTPSDVIRTIVTEVLSHGMDAFFDWRMDVKSLHSNGFSLKNLEPENLAISFTLLGLGPTSAFGDKMLGEHLENLKIKMKLLLGTRYAVDLISLVDIRNIQGGIDINGNIFIKSDAHVDIGWTLKALIGLSNFSVDLISLSINGSRLSLQVFPVSFLVTNRIFSEKMLDRSSVEHQNIAKDLSDTLTHILGKYENLLQVAIRKITSGSLVCHGDVIFQPPAPTNKDVLQTLAHSVGPKDYLNSSSFQVDPFSFNVAGAGLEPSLKKSGVPGYAVALVILGLLALIAALILVWLPKVLGWQGKITINRERDTEVSAEAFQLDNPGYHTTIEEGESKHSCILMETIG